MIISIENRVPVNSAEEAELRQVFFNSSSVKKFNSEQEQEVFFQRWLGQYLTRFPDWTWLACHGHNIVGYLVADPRTHENWNELNIPGMDLFYQQYEQYPVGLHINLDEKARGQKLGERLIEKLVEKSLSAGLSGIHAITSVGVRNVNFYRKLHFLDVQISSFKGHELLLMGRRLEESQHG